MAADSPPLLELPKAAIGHTGDGAILSTTGKMTALKLAESASVPLAHISPVLADDKDSSRTDFLKPPVITRHISKPLALPRAPISASHHIRIEDYCRRNISSGTKSLFFTTLARKLNISAHTVARFLRTHVNKDRKFSNLSTIEIEDIRNYLHTHKIPKDCTKELSKFMGYSESLMDEILKALS